MGSIETKSIQVKIDDALREIKEFNDKARFDSLLISSGSSLVVTLTRNDNSASIKAEIVKKVESWDL